MALKGWDESYSVRIGTMDDDHKKLVNMISGLYDAMSVGRSKELLAPLITDMEKYAMNHFAREEKYIQEKKPQEYATQKAEHQEFLSKVAEFRHTLQSGNIALAVKVLPFLNQWFFNHIMKRDMQYKPS